MITPGRRAACGTRASGRLKGPVKWTPYPHANRAIRARLPAPARPKVPPPGNHLAPAHLAHVSAGQTPRKSPLGHPVSRARKLRPIRCAKCGQKFDRAHGAERYCPGCRPRRLATRAAIRAATRPVRQYARKHPEVTLRWAEVFDSECPHHGKLGTCAEPWCLCWVEDDDPARRLAPGLAGSPRDEGGRFEEEGPASIPAGILPRMTERQDDR